MAIVLAAARFVKVMGDFFDKHYVTYKSIFIRELK